MTQGEEYPKKFQFSSIIDKLKALFDKNVKQINNDNKKQLVLLKSIFMRNFSFMENVLIISPKYCSDKLNQTRVSVLGFICFYVFCEIYQSPKEKILDDFRDENTSSTHLFVLILHACDWELCMWASAARITQDLAGPAPMAADYWMFVCK